MFFKKILFLQIAIVYLLGSSIEPIPQTVEYNYEKALLGKKLFFDPILSKDNSISCATCHDLKNGGDDGLKFSVGIDGQIGDINAPTVLNSFFNFRQFWDGRAHNLEEQALGPIENPVEMGHDFAILVKKLKVTTYNKDFKKIYIDGITKENLADAIAEFEKTLITPNSAFDRFLKGDETAITSFEKEGYELFRSKGCISCHNGVNIGGNLYSKFGMIVDIDSKHLGKYNITKNEWDKYYFKVPSLRNISLTAPYFHDGRYDTLKEAVKTMSLVQLGRPITEKEIEKIVAFLKTLNGELIIIK
ncbi:cytochrome-c peroxidase [Halarcobacter bivalviorum]|uniref:cytochrome-c peroxidase n=1 Tax=Halarcobacter bivalviorum TaxID=663364 RepID=UPI00100B02BC|nr:cytochrome-c peroxidase [Halarcobacter bivalviorum]RXK05264.1 cytochrome B6 [Halarcobacter bivalviorum]